MAKYKIVSTFDANDEIELSATTEDAAYYEGLATAGWELIEISEEQ